MVDGEGKLQDYKLHFDPTDEKARVDLVKNLVAMANAGGGQIVFGRSETEIRGIDDSACQALDSARLSDFVSRYVKPSPVDLSHEIQDLGDEHYLLIIRVAASVYPVVISRTGDWKGKPPKKPPLFREGDVWIRHSSKTERITYEDLRSWIERAKQEERERVLSRITMLVNLPDDAEIQVVSADQPPLDSPQRLLEYAALRHQYDSSHLLTTKDLAWLFMNRDSLEDISEGQIRLLIASALRRPPTLYWWILLVDDKPAIILDELQKCLQASDRDKSDAAHSVIEMAAIFASDVQLSEILEELRGSRYKHFRKAAEDWLERTAMLNQLHDRIAGAKYAGKFLHKFSNEELEKLATEVAIKLLSQRKTADSRKLADITRVIWSKKSTFAKNVLI